MPNLPFLVRDSAAWAPLTYPKPIPYNQMLEAHSAAAQEYADVLVVPDGLLGARLERLLGCRARHQGRHGLLPLLFMQQRSELRRFGLLRILLQLDARFPTEARAPRRSAHTARKRFCCLFRCPLVSAAVQCAGCVCLSLLDALTVVEGLRRTPKDHCGHCRLAPLRAARRTRAP